MVTIKVAQSSLGLTRIGRRMVECAKVAFAEVYLQEVVESWIAQVEILMDFANV